MLSAKPWRTEAVFFFLVAQMLCFFVGATAMALLQKVGVAGFKNQDDPGCILLGTLCLQGVTWVLMGIFFRQHGISWCDGLGFDKKKLLLSLLLAIGTLVVILPIAGGLKNVSVFLMEKIGWKPEEEAAVSMLTDVTSPALKIYLIFFTVIIAPVAEEFFFRGVLFTFIKQQGFPKTAWIGVNLFFAFVHADTAIFIPLFVLSLALTWLYVVMDSLMASIFGHALFNIVNLLILKYSPQ
jgi:uncharacterized protein